MMGVCSKIYPEKITWKQVAEMKTDTNLSLGSNLDFPVFSSEGSL